MKRLCALAIVSLALLGCGKDEDKRAAEPAAAPATRPAPPPAAVAPEPALPALPAAPATPAAGMGPAGAAPAGGESTYTIVQGDTLGAIARRTGVSVQQLIEWNGIDDPRRLRIGQQVRLTPPGR